MPLSDPRMSAGAIVLNGIIPDLASAADTAYFVAPEAGYIKEFHCVRDSAAGTGTADLQITTQKGAVTPVMVMVTAGAAGDVDSLELSRNDPNNELVAGEGFSIATDGDFSLATQGDLTVVLEPY